MNQRGSVSVVLLGVVALLVVLGAVLGAVGQVGAAHSRAQTAADAAALAAAPVTFRPFGAAGGPVHEAARFAAANGARLVRCSCPVDRGWGTRTVEVETEVGVELPVLGKRAVRAVARAEFAPIELVR